MEDADIVVGSLGLVDAGDKQGLVRLDAELGNEDQPGQKKENARAGYRRKYASNSDAESPLSILQQRRAAGFGGVLMAQMS